MGNPKTPKPQYQKPIIIRVSMENVYEFLSNMIVIASLLRSIDHFTIAGLHGWAFKAYSCISKEEDWRSDIMMMSEDGVLRALRSKAQRLSP